VEGFNEWADERRERKREHEWLQEKKKMLLAKFNVFYDLTTLRKKKSRLEASPNST
jgi:hypothetical protein